MGTEFQNAFIDLSEELELQGIKLRSPDGVSFSLTVNGVLDKVDELEALVPQLRRLNELREQERAAATATTDDTDDGDDGDN